MISPDVLYHLIEHGSLANACQVAAALESGMRPSERPRKRARKQATTAPPARARTERARRA